MVSRALLLLVFTTLPCACSKPPLDLAPVTGSVRYADGTVPSGEMRVIRFEPLDGWKGRTDPRPATATLSDDGSFAATTLRPGDGIVPGEYKVILLFFESRIKRNAILPDEYSLPSKTPLPFVTVELDQVNHFDLVVEKRVAR